MSAKHKTLYGSTCYPGGRTIHVLSTYQEWTDWAVSAIDSRAALIDCLKALKRCPGIGQTDQVSGETFALLIEEALSKAEKVQP